MRRDRRHWRLVELGSIVLRIHIVLELVLMLVVLPSVILLLVIESVHYIRGCCGQLVYCVVCMVENVSTQVFQTKTRLEMIFVWCVWES